MTSRGLVALALGLAWLTTAAGQEPANDKKGPTSFYGFLLGQVGEALRSAQVVETFRSAKTPQDRYSAIRAGHKTHTGVAANLCFVAAQHFFGYEPTEPTRLPRAALPFLVEALKDEGTWEEALTETYDGWLSISADSFARTLDEIDPDARAAVARVASPILTKALKDRGAYGRLRAAHLLIVLDKANAKVALPVLITALYSGDRTFNFTVDAQLRGLITSLGPDDGVIQALTAALKDEHPRRRVTVATLLIDADEKYAGIVLPVLRAALKGEDRDSRLAAIHVLRDLGPAARGAVPELIGLLTTDFRDFDHSVAAAETLAKLDKKEYADAALPALRAALKDVRARLPGRPISPLEFRDAVADAVRRR